MARTKAAGAGAPKKPGRLKQLRQVFHATRKADPSVVWWMLLWVLVVLVVMVGIGILLNAWVYFLILALPLAVLAATIVLSRKAERAAYRAIEGQPGAAGAALTALRRGWFYDQQPVAADAQRPGDMASAAMVFRAVGRPGVVLIGEGPKARVTRLLDSERKRVTRVAPGVQVTVLRIGRGEAELPVAKLGSTMRRMKPVLTKAEAAAVNKRLKGLGGIRPPIPGGVDPLRVRADRKAMRGR